MTTNSHRVFQMACIIFLLVSACQNVAATPATIIVSSTKTPIATATSSPIPKPTAIIPPTLGPTPNITPPTFEGFDRVELLPDNFFIAYQSPPGEIFTSLSIGGSGGGEPKKCSSTPLIRIRPKLPPPFTNEDGIGGPGALELCHFPLNEDVEIKITKPSGDVSTITIHNSYKIQRFCLPGPLVLESGKYQVEASSLWANATMNFTLEKPEKITAYFPETFELGNDDYSWCVGGINTGSPTAIYFRGLEPNKSIQLLVYLETPGYFLYRTTWRITPDNKGNAVEYIENPQIDSSFYSFSVNVYDPNSSSGTGLGEGGFSFTAKNSTMPTPTPFSQPFPTEALQPKWVQIPYGPFLMGASPKDTKAESVEKPQHSVMLTEYWIQNNEVTNANYSQCVGAKKCTPPQSTKSKTRAEYYENPKYANYPVIYVTYDQAKQYCEWLGGKLPREAEWEKAARSIAPNNEIFPWPTNNNESIDNVANFGNLWRDTLLADSYKTGGLGSFFPEIKEMAGNVWEWVEDWYKAYPDGNPNADKNFGEKFRVIRGGSFASAPEFLRISNRFYKDPTEASDSVGFRCVRTTAP